MKTAHESNQVMMLTPSGAAAIAVMRICGPKTREFLARHFSREVVAGKPAHGILSRAVLRPIWDGEVFSPSPGTRGEGRGEGSSFDDRSRPDPPSPQPSPRVQGEGERTIRSHMGDTSERESGGSTIDDPVVVIAADGTWADICLHGGPAILAAALDLAERWGFEVQSPFESRAPSDAPLRDAAIAPARSLLESEMLAWLPMARTELALRTLLDQPRAWKAVEKAAGDSSNPNTRSANPPSENSINLGQILADRSLWNLLHPPRVAIIGIPNAGKSTLANQLFGQARSITADIPGTTRDWVGEMANINGLAVMLVDTPGIRQSIDPLESAAIANSAGEIQRSDLVVLVVDASQSLELQLPLQQAWPDALMTINKIDRPVLWDITRIDGVKISAKIGIGVDELRKNIAAAFGIDAESSASAMLPRIWTDRQQRVLTQAVSDPNILRSMWNRTTGDH